MQTLEQKSNRNRNLRQAILDLYGRQCYHCAYKKDERALVLDHINSHPKRFKHRSGTSLYRAILSGEIPDTEFQILCSNCNQIKRLITPSERSRNSIAFHETNLRPEMESVETNLTLIQTVETKLSNL